MITARLRALLPTRNLSSLKAPHESAPRCLPGQLGKERAFPFAISQAGCICPVSPGRRVSLPEPRLSPHCCSRAQSQPIRKTRTLQSPLKGGFINGKRKGHQGLPRGKFPPQFNGRRRKGMSVNWFGVRSSLEGEQKILLSFETAGTE